MPSTDLHEQPGAVPRSGPPGSGLQGGHRPWARYVAAVLGLVAVQRVFSVGGDAVARAADTSHLDPSSWWAPLTVHHLVQGVLALALLVALSRGLGLDVGLRVGDARHGARLVGIVATVLALYLLAHYGVAHVLGLDAAVAVPQDGDARAGYLAFQLLASGPSEELLFRALPIAVLVAIRPVVLVRRGPVTLEAVVAAALFSLAHVAVAGGTISADAGQLAYAFTLGVVQGVVLQRTRSVLYPMAIHSISNVLVTGAAMLAG